MRTGCRIVSRALFALALGVLVCGLATLALSLAVATWPLRRISRDDARHAQQQALQDLLFALAGVVAVRRGGAG